MMLSEVDAQVCTGCRKRKALDLFGTTKAGNPRPRCRACVRASSQRSYARNRQAARLRQDARVYGISVEEVERLRQTPCEVCGSPGEAIDHDHTSGRLRGSLCQMCNRGLGHFGDDVDRLRAAIAYLEARS